VVKTEVEFSVGQIYAVSRNCTNGLTSDTICDFCDESEQKIEVKCAVPDFSFYSRGFAD
jgi:hypothetical protein